MDTTDITNAIAGIVAEVVGIDTAQVNAETSFTDDLNLDSLAMMEIAVAIEDRFEVRIPDDQVSELRTVGDAVDYVTENL